MAFEHWRCGTTALPADDMHCSETDRSEIVNSELQIPRIHAPIFASVQRRQMIIASSSIMPIPITSTASATGKDFFLLFFLKQKRLLILSSFTI
jgi:hypothetical protein